MARDDRQLNVRLPPHLFEVLEAAAYAYRVTPATLVIEAAEESIGELAKEAPVRKVMEGRAEADGEKAGKVSSLSSSGQLRRRS